MAVNTSYLNTAGAPAGVSNQSQIAGSQASFVNVEITSGLTVGGAVQLNSTISLVGALSAGAVTAAGALVGNSTLSMVGATSLGAATASSLTVTGILASTGTADFDATVFLSKQTTASLTSATLANGELSIGSVSVTSATMYFRSGNTTYEFIAAKASVL